MEKNTSTEDYEVIPNDSSRIKELEQKLKEKENIIADLLTHFKEFGSQINKKVEDLSDRIQVIKMQENEGKKSNWLQEAYMNDLEDFRTTLRNLLFYKESVEQTYKK